MTHYKSISISPGLINQRQHELIATLPEIDDDPLQLLVTAIALESIAADLRVKASMFTLPQDVKSQNHYIVGASGDT